MGRIGAAAAERFGLLPPLRLRGAIVFARRIPCFTWIRGLQVAGFIMVEKLGDYHA